MQVTKIISRHRPMYKKARIIFPLLLPVLLGLASLHPIATFLILVLCLVACFNIVIVVAPPTCSLEDTSLVYKSGRVCGFLSDVNMVYKCSVIILLLWYFTMLIPVNLENKLLYKEIIVYNILIVVCVHLVQVIRNAHPCSVSHTVISNSQYLGNKPGKNENNLTIIGLWKHTLRILRGTNKFNFEGDWYFAWMNIFVSKFNRAWSIVLLTVSVVLTFYSTSLALTSVCTPKIYFDWFLLPHDCTFIYDVYSRAWVFVTVLFWLITSIIPISFLSHELVVYVRHRSKNW
uniref:SJCHGC09124 protein n=1 Tax=Schistosoma japonicum TaxID=6182 RepID=Q5D929_SCHJA|nr:SJCHGC09124 protein [Schistosoma japonicum]